jgi:hypothetical protein
MLRGHSDVKFLSGFTIVGGNGLGLPVSSVISVLTLPNVVYMRTELGTDFADASIHYKDLTALEVGGGAQTTGRTFFGGGFGLSGAVEGMLVASALTKASQKTTIHTGMHIGSVNGEVLLHHGELTPR